LAGGSRRTHITPDTLLERPYPAAHGSQGTDLYINASAFRDAFAGDLPRSTTELMQATPAAPRLPIRPVGGISLPTIPT